jgi:hypothetical protein
VPGLTGSRLPGRVGVVGAGEDEGAKRSRDGVDGEEGKSGAGRDFLGREEGGDGEEPAFATEGRFGVRGAGGLIMGRVGEDGGGEGEASEERFRVGDESEASLSEGGTKLVNPGNRNRCSGGRQSFPPSRSPLW